jgi:acylphosphatase
VRLTKLVRVYGHVQGVWFRDWTIREARALGIDGWVRNRRDGTVEALIAGGADALDAMIEKLRVGSPDARVDRLEIEASDENVAPGFSRAATL